MQTFRHPVHVADAVARPSLLHILVGIGAAMVLHPAFGWNAAASGDIELTAPGLPTHIESFGGSNSTSATGGTSLHAPIGGVVRYQSTAQGFASINAGPSGDGTLRASTSAFIVAD